MAATAPPANATNAELVRWSFDAINRRDVAGMRALWSDETREQFPDRVRRGADEMARYFEELFAAVPDVRIEVVQVVAEGDDVFARWHLSGTHTGGPWAGIETTGRPVELDGVDHFTIRDGKIVSNFIIYDQMAVARAFGLLPPDGSQADRALKAAFNAKTKVADAIRAARS